MLFLRCPPRFLQFSAPDLASKASELLVKAAALGAKARELASKVSGLGVKAGGLAHEAQDFHLKTAVNLPPKGAKAPAQRRRRDIFLE